MSSTHSDPQVFNSTVTFNGTVAFNGSFTIPDNSVTNSKVIAGAELSAAKLQHRHSVRHSQKDSTDVVSETILSHVARAAGTVKRVCVRPRVKPTGGDKQYTVDFQKAANGSNSWTSLLTAVLTLSNTVGTNDTVSEGTLIGSPTYSADDAFRWVITATGTTGSQGQGFVSQAFLDENGA